MTPARAAKGVVAPAADSLRRIKELVIERTGLAYYVSRDDVLGDRIQARIAALGLAGPADYLGRLTGPAGEREWEALIDEIVVGESYFFRFAEQFAALRHLVLPDCLERRRQQRSLRIWSAGCASGAEPYSVAMLFRRELSHLLAGWQVSILGTDISRRQLARAEAGEFGEWDLRQTPEAYRTGCFERRGPIWRLRDEYRRDVAFKRQNLLLDGPGFAEANAGGFDIVFCRNVMIYFDPEVSRRLLLTLHKALGDGGWLFVGHAEPHLQVADVFQPVPLPGTTLYRKQAAARELSRPDAAAARPAARAEPERRTPALSAPGAGGAAAPAVGALAPLGVPAKAARAPRDEAPAEGAERHLPEVRELASRGEWAKASAICLDLLARDPLDADLHYLQALILGQTGDPASERSLKHAIYLDRGFALAHYHLGLATAARGDGAAAARSMRNALRALRGVDDGEPVRAGDGLTAVQLKDLVDLQLRFGERRR